MASATKIHSCLEWVDKMRLYCGQLMLLIWKIFALFRLPIPDSVNILITLAMNNISIESIPLSKLKKINYLIILSAFWILEKLLIAYVTMLIIWIIIDTLASWNFNVLSSKTKKYPMLLFPILGFVLKASATKIHWCWEWVDNMKLYCGQ